MYIYIYLFIYMIYIDMILTVEDNSEVSFESRKLIVLKC